MNILEKIKQLLVKKGIPEDKADKIVNKTQNLQIIAKEEYVKMIEYYFEKELKINYPDLKEDELKRLKSQRRMGLALELYKLVIQDSPEFLEMLKNDIQFILKTIDSDLEKRASQVKE